MHAVGGDHSGPMMYNISKADRTRALQLLTLKASIILIKQADKNVGLTAMDILCYEMDGKTAQ